MLGWLRRWGAARSPPEPSVTAVGSSVAAGRDISNSQITIGLDEEGVGKVLEEKLEKILARTAAQKSVPVAPLRAVLEKLGAAHTAIEEIPKRLAAAADELIQLRADLARLRNDRPEFAAIRARASKLIDRGELDAATAELRKGREAARELREDISRSEAGFLLDEARVDRLQLNYEDACA